MIGEPLPVPLSIAPRKPAQADERPIIAIAPAPCVTEDGELVEAVAVELEDGARLDWRTFMEHLPDHGPAIIVVHDAFATLLELNEYWEFHSQWQWTIYPQTREWEDTDRSYGPPNVARFGFTRYGQARRSRYFQILSPARFSEAAGNMLADADLTELVKFGQQVRGWCVDNNLLTRSSAASIGTALLTDERFEPQPRRKVPAATNCRGREQLPGNHYRLTGSAAKTYPQVRKTDLSGAHHRAALATQFPDPNTLRAKGRWRLEAPTDGQDAQHWAERPYAWRYDDEQFPAMMAEHGLFLVVLRTPAHAAADELRHPALARAGVSYRYIWSTELEHLRAHGGRILAIVAQWTSPNVSEQLNQYALWALAELDAHPQCREWLKPALLSTYGVLAARPRRFRVAYRHATGGKEIAFPAAGGNILEGVQYTTVPREPRTANVIARGLIEASVRARVLDAARKLRAAGEQVLEVWADSIFLDGAGPFALPLEPAWRDEGILTNVRFYDSTHVVGDGFVKLPGVHGERREEIASIEYRRRYRPDQTAAR